MPEVSVDVQVWCECGEGLCGQSSGGDSAVTVDPCEKCLDERGTTEYDSGYNTGYADGYDEGVKDTE